MFQRSRLIEKGVEVEGESQAFLWLQKLAIFHTLVLTDLRPVSDYLHTNEKGLDLLLWDIRTFVQDCTRKECLRILLNHFHQNGSTLQVLLRGIR